MPRPEISLSFPWLSRSHLDIGKLTIEPPLSRAVMPTGSLAGIVARDPPAYRARGPDRRAYVERTKRKRHSARIEILCPAGETDQEVAPTSRASTGTGSTTKSLESNRNPAGRRGLSGHAVAGTGLLALGALVSLTAPAAAHAHAHLEPHRPARHSLPAGKSAQSSGAALLGDGRVIVGGEHEVAALLPSGRSTLFGKDGIAHLVKLRGESAYISEIAADPVGRPVVVGFIEGAARLESFIERLTPAGRIDRSFGAGRGYLLGNFGIPAPSTGGAPSSFPESVDFDSAGRMLVTGRAATGTNRCR